MPTPLWNWGPRRSIIPLSTALTCGYLSILGGSLDESKHPVSRATSPVPSWPQLMAGVIHCLNQQDMLDAQPGPSDTNGFGFSSRSRSQWELHSCCAGPGCLSGRLVFDGVGPALFPLSTIMQTSLSAGALTSPLLMSSYQYVSHVSVFLSELYSSCNPPPHPFTS